MVQAEEYTALEMFQRSLLETTWQWPPGVFPWSSIQWHSRQQDQWQKHVQSLSLYPTTYKSSQELKQSVQQNTKEGLLLLLIHVNLEFYWTFCIKQNLIKNYFNKISSILHLRSGYAINISITNMQLSNMQHTFNKKLKYKYFKWNISHQKAQFNQYLLNK